MSHNKIIVTLTGPSASGKSTLENMLAGTGLFHKAVSTTTRDPREGEVDGVDYHFVSHNDFYESQDNFEFAESVRFKGNGYAVSEKEIERAFDSGKHIVIVCEPNGAKQIYDFANDKNIPLLQVYIDSDFTVLVNRFIAREVLGKVHTPEKFHYTVDRLRGLTEEYTKWRELKWDVVLDYFNEANQADVVGFLCDHAEMRERIKIKAS